MALRLQPNMEGLLWSFLVEQPELLDLIGERVYSALPAETVYPAVRLTQIDDEPVTSQPLWVTRYFIQLEAFGGSKSEAWRIAETCRALLDERLTGVHEAHGVVNGIEFGGLQDAPDETFEPAKPRFLFTCTITARPLATLGGS